jgi:two-component system NtrC family sensor kinase
MSNVRVHAVPAGVMGEPPPRPRAAHNVAPQLTAPELCYRELFLALAEELPDAIFTKDLQGRYTFINTAGARFLGLPVEQILGRRDTDLMGPEEARSTMEFDRQTLLAGRTLRSEMSEWMAGVQREWLSTKGLLRSADGQPVGLFGISRDMSDQRRSEAARSQSEALFRTAASSSFDAFFIVRNEPEGLRLLHVNTHGEALLGCTAREAEGHLLGEFPHAAFIAPLPLCQEVWRTGKPHDEEFKQALPRHEQRWFRRQLSAVGECLAVMVRDITEHRENELRLRLNERMAAVGMLASGVAHEINNPLAFVLSNLHYIEKELVRLKLPLEDMGEMREAITDAREGAERMRGIVQSLRALARGDAVTTQPIDLHEVLDNSVQLSTGRLRSHGLLVREYGEVPLVLANSVQLSQVFVNLLVNAAQAMPKSGLGEIRVTTQQHSASMVRVEVQDNGCGIPAENLERIFEPFFTTKPVGEGTGLGLSISHDIIRGLGGELTVSSTPGMGTTFRILLPVATAAMEQEAGQQGAH